MIGLEEGLLDTTFEDYLREMLTDWKILEDYFQRVLEAITFQYTYWPAPSNRTARSQEFINVGIKKYNNAYLCICKPLLACGQRHYIVVLPSIRSNKFNSEASSLTCGRMKISFITRNKITHTI